MSYPSGGKKDGEFSPQLVKSASGAFANLEQQRDHTPGTYSTELQQIVAERNHIHRLLLKERRMNQDSELTQTFMLDAMTAQKNRLHGLYQKEHIQNAVKNYKIKTLLEQGERHDKIVKRLTKENEDLASCASKAEDDRGLFDENPGIPLFARPATRRSYSIAGEDAFVALIKRTEVLRTHDALYSTAPGKSPITTTKDDDKATIQQRKILTPGSVRRDRHYKKEPNNIISTGLAPTKEHSIIPITVKSPAVSIAAETERPDISMSSTGIYNKSPARTKGGETDPVVFQHEPVNSAQNTCSEAINVSSDFKHELRKFDVSAVDDIDTRDFQESGPELLPSGSSSKRHETLDVLMNDVMTNRTIHEPLFQGLQSQFHLPQLPLRLLVSSFTERFPLSTEPLPFAPASVPKVNGGSDSMWFPGLGNGQSYMAKNMEEATYQCPPMPALGMTASNDASTVAAVRAHSSTSACVAPLFAPCSQSTAGTISASVPVSSQATAESNMISASARPARRAGPLTMANSPRNISFHHAEVEKQRLNEEAAILGASSEKELQRVSNLPRLRLHPRSRKPVRHEAVIAQHLLKSFVPVAPNGDSDEGLRTSLSREVLPSHMALQTPPVTNVPPMFQNFVEQTTESQDRLLDTAAKPTIIPIAAHFPLAGLLSMAINDTPAIVGGPFSNPKQNILNSGPDEQMHENSRMTRILADVLAKVNNSIDRRCPSDEMDTDAAPPTVVKPFVEANSARIPMENDTELGSVSLQSGNLPLTTHLRSSDSGIAHLGSGEAAPPDGFAARIGFTNLNPKRNTDGTIIQDSNRQPKETAPLSVSRVVEVIQPSLRWLQKACRHWEKAKLEWGRIGAFDAREREEEMAWSGVGKVQTILDQFSIAQEFMVKVVQRKKNLFADLDHFITVTKTENEDMIMLGELRSKLMELKALVREADQDAMDEEYQEAHKNDFSFTPIPGQTFLKNSSSSNIPSASNPSSHKRSAAGVVTEQDPFTPELGEAESYTATASPGQVFQTCKKPRPEASAAINKVPASSVFASISTSNLWVDDVKSREDCLLRLWIFCSSLESQINAWKQRGALTYISKAEKVIHKQLEVQIREIQISWKGADDNQAVGLSGCVVRIYEETNLIELCRWIKKDMKEMSRNCGSHIKIMECMGYVRPAIAIIESHQAEQARRRNAGQVARDLANWEALYKKQGD